MGVGATLGRMGARCRESKQVASFGKKRFEEGHPALIRLGVVAKDSGYISRTRFPSRKENKMLMFKSE